MIQSDKKKQLFSKWMFGFCGEMEADDSWRFITTITGTLSFWETSGGGGGGR